MTLHLHKGSDLANREILAIAESDDFVKGTEKLICVLENLSLVKVLAGAGDYLGKQVQRVDILKDVGLAVGDEHHVEFVQWLVNKSHVILFDRGVLRAAVGELGEGREKRLYSRAWHLAELPREDSFPSTGADRCG